MAGLGEGGALTTVGGFEFGGWNVDAGLEETPVVEPGDVLQGGDLDLLDGPPRPVRFDQFGWDARCAEAGVRKITVHDGRRSCGTLLADLDVHPRVAVRIPRHAQFALTMEIYTLASPASTREALRRLGASLDHD